LEPQELISGGRADAIGALLVLKPKAVKENPAAIERFVEIPRRVSPLREAEPGSIKKIDTFREGPT
jgi:hypothetical protein